MLIAQLSDPHVRPRGELYQGVVDSNAALREAIAHLHALDRRPDLVLVTGDLVDHGQPDEYAMARELLDTLAPPYLVIPGNHDDREALRAAFADHAYLPRTGPLHYVVEAPPLRLIGLDSCVPGRHHGHIDDAGLRWLADTLAAAPSTPTLVMLHHPPFRSGIPYMDPYRYLDPGPLAAVIAAHRQVEAVLCGHVHRLMLRRWAGTVVCACPSTVTEIDLQLRPDAPSSSHAGPRGCLLHLWDEREGLITHVSAIGPGRYEGPFGFA